MAALAAGVTVTSSSRITPTAPARLSSSAAPAQTTATAAVTSSAGSAAHDGPLPNTGLNLLPETVLGVILVGAGALLRLRRSGG